MSAAKRLAVVTGSNKGIGLAVVRGLCKKFNGDVLLTARNEALGQEAVKKLNGEGLHPRFHQLDICDKASIERLRNFLHTTYGGLDVLVNNAAISGEIPNKSLAEKVEITVKTNVWAQLDLWKSLSPLLKPHARVVNVSSRASHMAAQKCSDELKAKFDDPNMMIPDAEKIMMDFVSDVKQGDYVSKGWADFPMLQYFYSKLGFTLLSFAMYRELAKESREDIVLNVCCPGYTDTALNDNQGTRSVEEGADTVIYCALLPPNITAPNGAFVAERKEIPFKGPEFWVDVEASGYA